MTTRGTPGRARATTYPPARSAAARLEAILDRPADPGAIERIALEALRIVAITELTPREERLVALAEELGRVDGTRPVLREHAHVYLALACCSWALDRTKSQHRRDAAVAAAIILAATAGENLREVMGLNDKLRVAAGTGIDPALAACAVMVAAGQVEAEPLVERTIRPTLRQLERRGAPSDRARETG